MLKISLSSFVPSVFSGNFISGNGIDNIVVAGFVTDSCIYPLSYSPYIVVDDVTVINDAVLTIEAGVEVRFDSGTKLNVGYYPVPYYGGLVAEGVIDAVIDVRGLIRGYDVAGAILILNEAGGAITDSKGMELHAEVGKAQNISLIAALEPEMYKSMFDILSSK